MIELDYQIIVNLIADFLKYAIPIGLLFGLTEKLCNLFFSMAFGKEKINL